MGPDVPGSIWQFTNIQSLKDEKGVVTGAIRQSDFGTGYQKPTRLLGRLPGMGQRMALGWPSFDGEDKYLGPLTKFAGDSVRLIGREGADFKTTSTAAWPLQLCDWLAKLTAEAAQASRTSTPAEALAIGVVGGRFDDQEPDKQ